MSRLQVEITGLVQGVGFRPFVYRLARDLAVGGFVRNSPQGVLIEIEGSADQLARMLIRLRTEIPPRARIFSLESRPIRALGEREFRVEESAQDGPVSPLVLPDLALCQACACDIGDASDRRYRYPFTNCTDCGPRYSILLSLPYDRQRTTMARFTMCSRCLAEYRDPGDRRFHAQPNACPDCGPHLQLWTGSGRLVAERDEALQLGEEVIRSGGILALKGLGGFHLMVDARNGEAVTRLRRRKSRPHKPLAVMAEPEWSERNCLLTELERELLLSTEAPIVLTEFRAGRVLAELAPGMRRLGVMRPYTPLHQILLADLGFPVVATSGNRAGEPIVTDERKALESLAGIADMFLVHDRPIARPVDDSVVQVVGGQAQVLRRARGYAPLPIPAPTSLPCRLALGGHQKSAIALSDGARVILGQHLGDLDTEEARAGYARAVEELPELLGLQPASTVCDLHPDYASTRPDAVGVQHHLAHVRAAMLDAHLTGEVLGVAFDGTGYGTDETIWGGEFFVGPLRKAHLRAFPLPGGEAAVREPRRCALGVLHELGLPFQAEANLKTMLERNLNCHRTSSAGRLFDAVAALCGFSGRVSYEGQAAAELEAEAAGQGRYPMGYADGILDWEPAIRALLADLEAGVPRSVVSYRFHAGLADGIVQVARALGVRRVVLTGGCFQNVLLTELTADALRSAGFEPYWHRQVPPNDGGLAAGQLWAD